MKSIRITNLHPMEMSDLRTQMEERVAEKKISYSSNERTLIIHPRKYNGIQLSKLFTNLDRQFRNTHVEVIGE